MNGDYKLFKRVRIAQGLTQEGLAKRMGCTRNYISMVENGHEKPNKAWLEKWKECVYM